MKPHRVDEDQDPLASTPYRRTRLLGSGTFGDVYEVEHRVLGTPLVVKLMHDKHKEDRQRIDRLRIEAQAAARLGRHPNIATVLDIGQTSDGRHYLVMERLSGTTLKEEVKERGPFDLHEAVRLALQALDGLSQAHALGIVHRDVKPENLFLCGAKRGEQVLKILDFGIAKVLGQAASSAPAPLALPTEEGVALGTPRYISPEQALGRRVDARADIYAMGGVLHFLLTGKGPFHHVTGALPLLRAHVSETPAPPSAATDRSIPSALDHIVLTALAKKPEDRFPNAETMAGELREIIEEANRTKSSAGRWAQTERIDTSVFRARSPAAIEEITAPLPPHEKPAAPEPARAPSTPPSRESSAETLVLKRGGRSSVSSKAIVAVVVALALMALSLAALVLILRARAPYGL